MSSKLEAVKITATATALRSTNANFVALSCSQTAEFDHEPAGQGTYETGKTHPGAFTEPTALSALSATLLTASAMRYPVSWKLALIWPLRVLRREGATERDGAKDGTEDPRLANKADEEATVNDAMTITCSSLAK